MRNVAVGDRVSIQPQMAPADEYYGKRGLYQLSPKVGVVGLSWWWGGMADLAIVNDYNAFLVPADVDDIQASLVEPAAVAVHAVDRAGMRPRLERRSSRASGRSGRSAPSPPGPPAPRRSS